MQLWLVISLIFKCNISGHSVLIQELSLASLGSHKGEPDAAKLRANADANHTCAKFCEKKFWQIFFF